MPLDAHLELKDVSKRFGRLVAVDGLSLAVPRGSIYGLLGPNGAGKTTTIRVIMRIALADTGEITLSGEPVTDALRERIGYLPEERGLYRKMRVLEHLVFLGQVRGLSGSEARSRSVTWLERMGLADRASQRVEDLSKGMQQKVQFAGAVMHDPELVILDEPFAGLDPIATRQLKNEIAAMGERGRTVLLSTHVLPQAEELCDSLCLINRGRAILQGTLAEARERLQRPALRVTSCASDDQLLVAGVKAVTARDGERLLELEDGASPADVIRELAAAVELESVAPFWASLEDIFLKAVEADHGALA